MDCVLNKSVTKNFSQTCSLLKLEREKQRLTLDQVASFLKTDMLFVKSLENLDFSHPSVNNTGNTVKLIHQYAALLNQPADLFITEYLKYYTENKNTQNTKNNFTDATCSQDLPIFCKIRWVMLCALILGIIELGYWSHKQNLESMLSHDPFSLTRDLGWLVKHD